MTTGGLIGRDGPLATVRGAVDALFESRGGLVLVTGDAGIGKTALAREAAGEARRRGALVLGGACWEGEGTPGYWPWVQVVRALRRSVTPEVWAAARDAAGDALPHLLGESGRAPGASAGDGWFRLADAVTGLLVAASRAAPVLAVVDDLQWADEPSIRVLEFAVHHTHLEAVLVVGTYRDVEVEAQGHTLRAAMRALLPAATAIGLRGLDLDGTAELAARAAGRDVDPATAAGVLRRTGGNPFFIEQCMRGWEGGDRPGADAPGMREALAQRIARLPAGTADLLSTAALLGREFDAVILAAACGTPVERASVMLGGAVVAGLVSPAAGSGFTFVHDLVREALVAAIPAGEARRRHASVVRAVAAHPALAARILPAQLAEHACLAIPEIEVGAALVHVTGAARDASRRLAAEEARGHYRRALSLLPAERAAERAKLALALAAEEQRAGDLVEARRVLDGLLSQGRAAVDAELVARAALGLHGLGHRVMTTGHAAGVLDEAHAMLGRRDGAPPLSARLLAARARERTHQDDADRAAAERLSAQAVDLARAGGDDETLGFCLLARHDAIWRPGTAAERLALARETVEAARRSSDRDLELSATMLEAVALLEQGDARALERLESFAAQADRARLPRQRYAALSRRATVATLAGRFDRAHALADEARELGERLGEADTLSVWADQVWELCRLQGRHDEVDAVVAELRGAGDPHVLVLATLSFLDRGDVDAALRGLPDLLALGERWPRWAGLMWLTCVAEIAAASRDPALRQRARAGLAPLAGQWAVLGGAVIVHGPMDHWSGVLEAAEGRWEASAAAFARAGRDADALGARPWSVLARLGRAEALLSGGEGDRAGMLLEGIERDADAMGMAPAAARARAALERPRHGSGGGPETAVFRFDGAVWTLTFAGRTALLPDAKGLRDLHSLLAGAGDDVAAVALLSGAGDGVAAAARSLGADPVLDERARTEYRRRLVQLDADVAAAEERGDGARIGVLEEERAALLAELRRATGLGGRSRRLDAESERARKTVTARIRDALARLDARHPELARHLRARVSTGTYCRYRPEAGTRWAL